MFIYRRLNSFRKAGLLCLIIFLPLPLSAQNPVPNSGFENWLLGDPVLWYTNNTISLKPITQSTDAYSGSSSVRMEILNNTIPYGATLFAGENGEGFPVNQQYTTLSGYFKYTPQSNTIFQVLVGMYQAGAIVGAGSMYISTMTNNWMPFNMPIAYSSPGNPDTCTVAISLTSLSDTGAVAYLDELSLGGTTGFTDFDNGKIPDRFRLAQNYPNPFNPSTTFGFSVPLTSPVQLVVYNQLGERVAVLVNRLLPAGVHRIEWQAKTLPSGVYFYKLTAGNFSAMRKLVLLK